MANTRKTALAGQAVRPGRGPQLGLGALIGSGDRIGAFILPFLLVGAALKHPLYTSVALLVLPWLRFLLDTWLGALSGIALYAASRLFAPAEEADLAEQFGPRWDGYCRRVKVPWL